MYQKFGTLFIKNLRKIYVKGFYAAYKKSLPTCHRRGKLMQIRLVT